LNIRKNEFSHLALFQDKIKIQRYSLCVSGQLAIFYDGVTNAGGMPEKRQTIK